MLDKIRLLLEEVSKGDLSKLESVDWEFENLVKNGSDQDVATGIRLLEDFLFANGQLAFEEKERKAS